MIHMSKIQWEYDLVERPFVSERLEEILRRFQDDWNALDRELRKFIAELRRGDQSDFPDLDPKVQVPFVRLVLEEATKGRELSKAQREQAVEATLTSWNVSARKSARSVFGRTTRCGNCSPGHLCAT